MGTFVFDCLIRLYKNVHGKMINDRFLWFEHAFSVTFLYDKQKFSGDNIEVFFSSFHFCSFRFQSQNYTF